MLLTLFRIKGGGPGGGGEKKGPLLVLTLFYTDIKFQYHTKHQSQIIELEQRTSLKKLFFSGQILIKLGKSKC